MRFTTSATAFADAQASAHEGLVRVDLIVDVLGLVVGAVLIANDATFFGALIITIAVLSLAGSRFHPFQRAIIAYRFRAVLGQPSTVTIDETGLRSESALSTSFLPWTSITAVRSSSRVLAFFRGHVLLGYIPSSAFASQAIQNEVAAFARSRVSSPGS